MERSEDGYGYRLRRPDTGSVLLPAVAGWATLNLVVLAATGFDSSWLATESLVLAGLFMLWPASSLRSAAALAIALFLVVTGITSAFDRLVQLALGRPLNLYLDIPLLRSALDLSLTNLGETMTALVVVAAGTWAGAIFSLSGLVLSRLPVLSGRRQRTAAALLLLTGAGLTVNERPEPFGAPAWVSWQGQLSRSLGTRADLSAFRRELAGLPTSPAPLGGLSGRNVLLVFVESYGAVSLTADDYASALRSVWQGLEAELAADRFAIRSGLTTSPVQGGQSWLAHMATLSGTPVSNQREYDEVLAYDRPTLIDDFAATGHRTLAVMPGNTRDWQAGSILGYDRVEDSRTMAYQGPPFNFVTQPDQYTLAWVGENHLSNPGSQPLFGHIALISSHAPWVPDVPLLDWRDVLTPSAFEPFRGMGPEPEQVFGNPAALRRYYLASIEYSLSAVVGFARRYLDRQDLLIVMGDHEASGLVSDGQNPKRRVAMHLISQDTDLLNQLTRTSGPDFRWQIGARPDMEGPAPPMHRWRRWLHSVAAVAGQPDNINSE